MILFMRPFISKLFFISLSLPITVAASLAYAETCGLGEIKSLEFGLSEVSNETYCFDDEALFFVSESCQKGSCLAEKQATKRLPVSHLDLGGPAGTPQSKLCEELGGTMRIVEFKVKERWVKSDLCRFSDQSFANGDLLMKENREAIQKQKEQLIE